MLKMVKRLCQEEEGQGMAEYGLVLALVAIAVVAALTALGSRISGRINEVNNQM